MSTLAYNQSQNSTISNVLGRYNKFAVGSILCALLFISYFFIPHDGMLRALFQFNVLFIVFAPLLGLALSVIGLRQITRTHDRGLILSYVALGITGLYFMVALAIPFVLIGLYFIYTFAL